MAFLDEKSAGEKTAEPNSDVPSTPSGKPSADAPRDWSKFFSGPKVPAAELRRLVADFHAAGKHEEVIALLEQAIIHGQIQPWMYEVLALTMEAVGRPRAQVERVLLSSGDLINEDADSILYLAAYLTKFERHQQALRLYRKVAVLEPLRVESYVMGLGIAEKLEDPVAAMWVIPGVLTRAWGKDRDDLHARAEKLAERVATQLKEDSRPLEAAALEQLTASARQRDLYVTLDWNGNGDLDLEIVDPSDATCTARHPATPGGMLHILSGRGPRQEDCREEAVAPQGLSGEYRIRIKHVGGDIVGKRARLTMTRYQGTPRETKQVQTIPLSGEGATVRVLLKGGRLTAPLDVPVPPATSQRRPRRGSLRVSQLPDGGRGLPPGAVTNTVGFQPVVAFVPSGVQLSALAVVSGDRRYVRISTSPLFTSLTDVFTFSFAGASTGGGNF